MVRPGGTRYVAYGCAAALVIMTIAITWALPADIRAQVTWPQALTLLGTLIAMIFLLHGLGRGYVRFDDERITIVNGFKTHRLVWEQVKGVSFKEGEPWPTLVTMDDDRILLFAIQRTSGLNQAKDIVTDIARRANQAQSGQ